MLIALIIKEWRLLWRDRIGLLILFALPMCLVMFLSLTQASHLDRDKKIKLLVIDRDRSTLSNNLVKALNKSKTLTVTRLRANNTAALNRAKLQVASADYHALLVIPWNATAKLKGYDRQLFRRRRGIADTHLNFSLYLDPGMPAALSDSIKLGITHILKQVELNMTQKLLLIALRTKAERMSDDLLRVTTHYASQSKKVTKPNSVQQNVPAWSLFGMFFIVIPLAGTMVRERAQGVIQRLTIAPVSQFTLLLGKLFAFIALNLFQLFLMLNVGVYILPRFGLSALDLYDHTVAVLQVGLAASLAATGFGILVGTWVRSYQQATVLGPFIIVIAAAIGGIFVPQYLMPESIQQISNLSPLHWAQASFLDIFIRDATLPDFLPNIIKLCAFFVICLLLSLPPFTYFIHRGQASE